MIELPWTEVHWPAVLVATVLHFMTGGVWYSPIGFGKAWSEIMKIHPDDIKKSDVNVALSIAAVATFVITWVLAVLIQATGNTGAVRGALFGLVVAATLVATTIGKNHAFEGRGMTFWSITVGQHAVAFALAGAILGGWR